jgi:hypothetical protein
MAREWGIRLLYSSSEREMLANDLHHGVTVNVIRRIDTYLALLTLGPKSSRSQLNHASSLRILLLNA